jgi:hypothetical protein
MCYKPPTALPPASAEPPLPFSKPQTGPNAFGYCLLIQYGDIMYGSNDILHGPAEDYISSESLMAQSFY